MIIIDKARVRHWISGNHTPYRGMLHDIRTDKEIYYSRKIQESLSGLPEGAIVSISVSIDLSNVPVDPEDFWCLLSPHTYGHMKDRK